MRIAIGLICGMLALTGCFHPHPHNHVEAQPRVTPDFKAVGRVELVNQGARYVVVSFTPGRVPPPGEHWSVNHGGLKIGDLKISSPQSESDTVADLVAGEANVGDEVTSQ